MVLILSDYIWEIAREMVPKILEAIVLKKPS